MNDQIVEQEAQQLLMGWPHQREHPVFDGVVLRDLDFEGLAVRIWS